MPLIRKESASSSSGGWSDAKSDFFSSAEITLGDSSAVGMQTANDSTNIIIQGQRMSFDVTIPDQPPFADYELWAFGRSTKNFLGSSVGTQFIADTVQIDIGDASGSRIMNEDDSILVSSERRIDLGDSLDESGDLAAEIAMESYSEDSALDNFEPAPGDYNDHFFAPLGIIAGPTFTHPFEAL